VYSPLLPLLLPLPLRLPLPLQLTLPWHHQLLPALDLTSSNDDYSQDSDVEVIVRTLQPAENKGKTPFIYLPGDIQRIMQDRLNENFSQGDPNSTSVETMKSSVGRVVERRAYLLQLMGGLNVSMERRNHHQGPPLEGHPHTYPRQDHKDQGLSDYE
jgi:hypothetical protein